MSTTQIMTLDEYGCDSLGKLTKVMLHRPGSALNLINSENHRHWLFDGVPDLPRFVDEHDRYRQLLEENNVEVIELADCLSNHDEQIARLPNLTYMHDIAVVSSRGAILSAMSSDARRGEERVVRDALERLGVPILIKFSEPIDAFEGCLLLSPQTLLVAETERHSSHSVQKFIRNALEHFEEVLYVQIPKARRFMHPDTIYNRIDHDLALAYPPAFLRTLRWTRRGVEPIDFFKYMKKRGVKTIAVTDAEQAALACSFVPLEPGVIIHYDDALSTATRRRLASLGVELILFHAEALHAGGGSLRCHTLRLHRSAGD